jgi:5'-phosphate synthase pdxT subunit
MPRIGILALQGAVDPHLHSLKQLDIPAIKVTKPTDLIGLQGLILPGGESSSMIHLAKLFGLWSALREFCMEQPAWGICAGSILLAKKVTHPDQQSLDCIDITVERNAFGRQVDSFIDSVEPTSHWKDNSKIEAVFIRAPRIRNCGPGVNILFKWHGEAVMVQQGRVLCSIFHPELTGSLVLHEYFLTLCQESKPWIIDSPKS